MTRALLALLLAAAAISSAQARDALQTIDDCVARLDNELDVGYARIAARCPELTAALTDSAFAPWLPTDWKRADNELSAAGLSELRAQLARESSQRAQQHATPRSERVAAVLATVARAEDRGGRSWWQRFKDWLHGLVTTRPRADERWLSRWFKALRLSTGTAELVGWAALATVVALAAAIIISELRIAGVLSRRAERMRSRPGDGARAGATLALADIERAAPEEQPRLLLELIALRLVSQQRLPPARALTARELSRAARLPEESTRTRLAELVAVCERVRFSAERVSAASLMGALRSGRLVLSALDGAALDAAEVS